MFQKKRILIQRAFCEAEKELPNASKSMLAAYISSVIEEKFNYKKDERTFVRYYTQLVQENKDYKIDGLTLDYISKFLGYYHFDEFCDEMKDSAPENNSVLEEILQNLVLIKESIAIVIQNFTIKQGGFGIIGIIIVGFVFNNQNFFNKEKRIINSEKKTSKIKSENPEKKEVIVHHTPQQIVYIPQAKISKEVVTNDKKRECMYWNGEFYLEVFCDEIIEGKEVIALNDERKLIKKITKPDTLSAENALGKVWYNKSNNQVEFFTHHGIHPENGKTLKEVTQHILEKYAKK